MFSVKDLAQYVGAIKKIYCAHPIVLRTILSRKGQREIHSSAPCLYLLAAFFGVFVMFAR